MSDLNQFISGAVPIGSSIEIIDGAANPTISGMEFLRHGSVKAYASQYDVLLNGISGAGVHGTPSSTYGVFLSGTTDITHFAGFVSSTYVIMGPAALGFTSLGGTQSALTSAASPSGNIKRVASNGTYIVWPHNAGNTAHQYTSNGTSAVSVGGTFTTHPVSSAIAFGNNIWVALSTMNGTAGEQSYIANANPSGSWTVTTAGSFQMTQVGGIAYGAGVFVAVGTSSNAANGKIATCTTPAGGWTDRTNTAGISFPASENISDVIFDGTKFVAITSIGRTINSSDGLTWTEVGSFALPVGTNDAGTSETFPSSVSQYRLVTDGAGKTIAYGFNASAMTRIRFNTTSDSGVTWKPKQPFISGSYGFVSARQYAIGYINNKWLMSRGGNPTNYTDLGNPFGNPDYIGYNHSPIAHRYLRIK